MKPMRLLSDAPWSNAEPEVDAGDLERFCSRLDFGTVSTLMALSSISR